MEEIAKKLQNVFNLSKYEAKLYLAALNFDYASLSDLAREAQIPRTAAYPPLRSLVSRGFISVVQIGKRKSYHALSPQKLPHILERRKIDLSEIIAELSKNINVPQSKLSIEYFPGIAGVEIASDIFLEEAKTKLGKSFENIIESAKTYGSRHTEEYIKCRIKRGIRARIIISGNIEHPAIKKLLEHSKEQLINSVVVSPQTYPLDASIAIIDDMILMFTSKEPTFAVLIKNKDLAKTLNSIHEMVWDRFRPEE